MRTLVISGVYGNLPALEAVLAHPASQSCQEIVSLGDQVNLGPQSREVFLRLQSLGAAMLLGVQESRVRQAAAHPFDGYNWNALRFTAKQLSGLSLDLPTDLHHEQVLYTHAAPGDPLKQLKPLQMLPLMQSLPAGVSCLITGHRRRQQQLFYLGWRHYCSGSVGLLEGQGGGLASFLVVENRNWEITVERCTVPYRVQDTLRAFLDSGMARAAPEISRAAAHVMLTGAPGYMQQLAAHARSVAQQLGLSLGDARVWQLADRSFPWPAPCSSADYWRALKYQL